MADGERAVGYLAEKLGESQPKVSRHLAFLRDHDVVSTRRDGKHIYYHVNVAPTKQTSHIRMTVYEEIEDEMPIYLL